MKFLHWLGLTKERAPVEVGAPAPDAVALDESDQEVHLRDYYQTGSTLVYFYPKAHTPGCTAQACHFRDDFVAIVNLGIKIIGISIDTAETQRRFKQKHSLPFTLLADPKRKAAQAFGVPLILGMTQRQSFLIQKGKIVWRDLHASTTGQLRNLQEVLQRLAPTD